jgi:thiol-disulfide isomerase/thioredoxin
MALALWSLPEREGTIAIDYPGFASHNPPQPVPDFEFAREDGEQQTLESLQGKIVLVNLWATWCPPCVYEMPSLDRLQAELGGEDFEVAAMSIDREGAEVVVPFFEEHGLEHLGIYLDSDAASARAFNARGFPTSILLDRQGRRIATYEGELEWDNDDVVDMLRRVIEG